MAISRLEFLLFYSVFLLFVIYIAGLGGADVLSAEGVVDFPLPTGDWWADFTLPFVYFWTFLFVSSEIQMVFSLILLPFIIGMVLVIAEMIRGN